jgi:hypothetical protein
MIDSSSVIPQPTPKKKIDPVAWSLAARPKMKIHALVDAEGCRSL